MKVLQVINNLGSGGAEKLIEQIVPKLNNIKNVTVDVLLLTNQGNVYLDSLKSKNVRIFTVKYERLLDPRNAFQISKLIRKEKYDIVHSHNFQSQYWVAFSRVMNLRSTTKFVTTEHSNTNRRRGKVVFLPIEKFVYAQYDKVISISESVNRHLLDWIKPKLLDSKKYVIIENGVDLNLYQNAIPYDKKNLVDTLTDDAILIAMISRFSNQKDQPTLILAMKNLPTHIHLLLIGEGELLVNNKNLVDEHHLSNRVHFLGFRDDVHRILKTVDIIVLSSFLEGLSLSSIEGMSSGKPFIASKVPGLEDIVGGAGVLFEQGNSEELSKIIYELVENSEWYSQVVDRCLQRSQQYSLDRMIANLVTLYEELVMSK